MPRPSITNLLASAAVALAVSAAVGGASPTPQSAPPWEQPGKTHGASSVISSLPAPSGPSVQQQLAALRKRVDSLQNRESQDRRELNEVALQAQDASDFVGCINGAMFLTFSDDGMTVTSSDGSEDERFVVPTLAEECVSTEDAS